MRREGTGRATGAFSGSETAPIVRERLGCTSAFQSPHDEFDRCSLHVRADGAGALFGCRASYPNGSSGAPTLEDWRTHSRNLRVIYSSDAGAQDDLRSTCGVWQENGTAKGAAKVEAES